LAGRDPNEEVIAAVEKWTDFAEQAGVGEQDAEGVRRMIRL